jgi:GntR family transcriptional regulator, transcriptional repressor for pyruvate dehydrogenase complex
MAVKNSSASDSLKKNDLSYKPLSAKRTFKEIANQIRESIYSNKLKPGDKLPTEREMAEQFQVGRVSVREALRMLEQAGLIVIKQGRNIGGAYVKATDTSTISESVYDIVWRRSIQTEDLTEVRLTFEKGILQSAFNKITEDDLKMLEKCIEELEILANKKKKGNIQVSELTNFHVTLAHATRNPLFEIILNVLMNVTAKVINTKWIDIKRFKKHIIFHKAILKGIKDHNLDIALEKMEEHMQEVGQYIKRKQSKP